MHKIPDDIFSDISDRLRGGACKRKSPIHTCVVGTAGGDMRVMVLRDFDSVSRTLRFHTDRRSPKVAAVQADPQMGVLAYDPDAKIQIRMRGVGRIESAGPAADQAWGQSTNFAKRCYLAEASPGASSSAPISGLPQWAEGINPDDEQVAPARENFAVLLVTISEFDWLYLANSGHRRAKIIFDADGTMAAEWLVP